jgi:hypothetical protein
MGHYDEYDRYSDELPRRRSRYDYDDDYGERSHYRRRLRYDEDDDRPQKHSRFGIASFILALCAGIFVFILVAIAGVLGAMSGGDLDENSPEGILLVLGFMAGCALNLISLGLAIAGLCEKRRNKVFAILGLAINVLLFFGGCGMVALGTLAG